MTTMYPLKVGCVVGTTTTEYVAGTSSSISFSGANVLLPAPNYATISTQNGLVTVLYSSFVGNTISGLTVIEAESQGSLTATYPVGSEIYRAINKVDLDAIRERLVPASTTNTGVVKIGTGITVTPDGTISAAGGDSVWGGITGDINNQTDLVNALSKKIGKAEGSPNLNFSYNDDGLFIIIDE